MDPSPDAIENYLRLDNDEDPLLELKSRALPDHVKKEMEGNLEDIELNKALMNDMKPNSAPGIDGFTVKFIRAFWESLRPILKDAVNSMKKKGKMTSSLRIAIIKLLLKAGKDPTTPGSYRPISLLSVLYKIASCAISNRIKKALPFIIGRQQKAYVSNDNIGSVLLNLLTLIEKCNKKKMEGLILLIDFKKAFDSINHQFIEKVLKSFNFGNNIIEWVSLFFNSREAMILMGGHLTQTILLKQGVPQGDIISPFIFIIVVEILLIKITKSKHIAGLELGSGEIRAQTFADDTTLTIERTDLSLRSCVRYIEAFKEISGLSANLDKTKVIPIGMHLNPKARICTDLDMEWDDNFKLLGFNIGNNLKNIDENFDLAHTKTLSLINDWRSRKLPLEGRISISKCLLISQYTYFATVLPLKDTQILKAQKSINNYIMNIKEGSKPWISKNKMYQPINKGGLNCIELSSFFKAIKLNWMKRYVSEQYKDFWTYLKGCL